MGYAAQIAQRIVPYEPAHRAALREFQRQYFGASSRQCDSRVFEWLFERNPNRRKGDVVLWLCMQDGEVIGQQAAIPVILKAGGQERRAAWGIDLMVHPAWHLKGIAPALISAFESSTDICLGLGLSDTARQFFMRRGWADMGRLPQYVRILRPRACTPPSGLLSLIAKAAPDILFSASASMASRIARTVTKSSLELVPRFDARIDRVWRAASDDYGVLVKRDYATLRWRFDEAPSRDAYQRYYLLHAGNVVAYAVTRRDALRGHAVVRIVDYLAPRKWLVTLLSSVLAESGYDGAAAIFVEQLNAGTGGLMRALGCWRLADSTQFMLHAKEDAPLRSVEAWFVTHGDSDCDHLPRDPEGDPDLLPVTTTNGPATLRAGDE